MINTHPGDLVTVFIHQGFGIHFGYALAQARRINPQTRIVVIGDATNRRWAGRFAVDHYRIEDFSKFAKEFRKVYRHLSRNPASYEIFCFQRWMILLEWWQSHPEVAGVLHFDSDVLTYAATRDIFDRWISAPMTYVNHCGHVCLIRDQKTLGLFVSRIMQWYSSEEDFGKLESIHVSDKKDGWAGISDMTMFRLFARENPGTLVDKCTPASDLVTVDLRMNDSAGGEWKFKDGLKHVEFREGLPVVQNLKENQRYRFLCLHFQGNSKWKMRRFVTAWSLRDKVMLTMFQVLHKLRIAKSHGNY